MHFTAETSSNGVVERNFTLGEVTGVLWSRVSGSDRAPLVLMGHGGGQLHANPGAHREIPAFELNSATRFFVRHLHRVGTSPA